VGNLKRGGMVVYFGPFKRIYNLTEALHIIRVGALTAIALFMCLAGSPVVAGCNAFDFAFENAPGGVPRITDVSCCSSKDGRVVVSFEPDRVSKSSTVSATIKVRYTHQKGSGTETLHKDLDVTEFVRFGEVRYCLKPEWKGVYRIELSFELNGNWLGMARFTQSTRR